MERVEPTLHLDVPDGWFKKESVTLLAPDGQANISSRASPLTRASTPMPMPISKAGCCTRDGVAVTQLQIYYAHCGRGYTATATTPSTSWSRFEPVFHRVLETLEIATQPTAS